MGSRVKGKVTKVTDFGAFVEIEPGIEGLVHVSELREERVENPRDVVQEGQEVDVKIIDINTQDRKVALSMKALLTRARRLPRVPAQAGRGQQGAPRRRDGEQAEEVVSLLPLGGRVRRPGSLTGARPSALRGGARERSHGVHARPARSGAS